MTSGKLRTLEDKGMRLERARHDDALGWDGFLSQLLDAGYAESLDEGSLILPWGRLHDALDDTDLHAEALLAIPPVRTEAVPELSSHGGLPSDSSYMVQIKRWVHSGSTIADRLDFRGPVCEESPIGPFTLGRESYATLRAVTRLNTRSPEERDERSNRLHFVDVRESALAAGAPMDRLMRTTIVVRPRMLRLDLDQQHIDDQLAVTVSPTFAGAPAGWLRALDRSRNRVRGVYSIPGDDGEDVHVVLDDEVQEVLTEIKTLPARRAVGRRARRLLENPAAFFGERAEAVIDLGALEESLALIRETLWSFAPHIERASDGRVLHIDLVMEPLGRDTESATEIRRIVSADGLKAFAGALARADREGQTAMAWAGRDLEVRLDAGDTAARLAEIAEAWEAGSTVVTGTPPEDETESARAASDRPLVISADFVLDLARYADRVESIGIETRFGIITVPLTEKGAWAPEGGELALLLQLDLGSRADVPLTREQLEQFVATVDEARAEGRSTVDVPGVGHISTEVAGAIVDALPRSLRGGGGAHAQDGAASGSEASPTESGRIGLRIKSNIDEADYVTSREERLRRALDAQPLMPRSLADGVELKQHQRRGLAVLQHLYAESPHACRGLLLADDMGLGKTLQILTLIAREREDDPDAPPALVVAPVTLLDNWRQEVERFFAPGALPTITLYGAGLREHRAKREEIDPQLVADGLTRFLRPGWHEGAALVLTTYETLRDYEFSFGEVTWSVVACDEAQRIKNPNALVSRAAKKLKTRFAIAATGTPVENNLTDLWSIFDFIQPGLLEPLNRFNRLYRRPIEARSDEERSRIEELRTLIEPQILRRTKAQVARDLPEKVFDDSCRHLGMSPQQSELYSAALNAKEIAAAVGGGGAALLNLLAILRRICTDPRSIQELDAPPPPIGEYRRRAPKMDWLIRTLDSIRERDEKALVFLDRRDVQRLVQHYVREHFGVAPAIINGETPTSGGVDSRQQRVNRFQETPGFAVLILSPVAAGVGLNIQSANHVIHYMRHWNPAKEDQATDRAYRIGQSRDVTVYTPIVRGDGWVSFDERLDELLERKRAIADDILNGTDAVSEADFKDLIESPTSPAGQPRE